MFCWKLEGMTILAVSGSQHQKGRVWCDYRWSRMPEPHLHGVMKILSRLPRRRQWGNGESFANGWCGNIRKKKIVANRISDSFYFGVIRVENHDCRCNLVHIQLLASRKWEKRLSFLCVATWRLSALLGRAPARTIWNSEENFGGGKSCQQLKPSIARPRENCWVKGVAVE